MKVLHLIPGIVPTEAGVCVGGSVHSLFNFLKICGLRIKSHVYTNTKHGYIENFQRIKLENVSFHIDENNATPGSVWYALKFMWNGFLTIFKNKAWHVDIIHGHSGSPFYGLFTHLLGKLLSQPTVHSLYCPVNFSKHNRFTRCIYTKLAYFFLRRVDKIIAMSENVRASLWSIHIPPEKIELMRPYIDTDIFTPECYSKELRLKLTNEENCPILLFVGNLKESKGIDMLIDALGILVPEYKFKFIYTLELKDAQFESKLTRIKRMLSDRGLSKRSLQLGIIDFMPVLMASSDIYIVPYRNTDGPSDYPIALLEAMASGVPAVVTNVGGIPELVDEQVTGLIVSPGNVEYLSKAIEVLLTDSTKRMKLGKNARTKALEIFQKEQMFSGINSIYQGFQNE